MMNLRLLGKTDLKVTPLGFGTVELGMPYEIGRPRPPDQNSAVQLLRNVQRSGINFFDTAPGYGCSEELVGRAFDNTSDRPLVATKVTLTDITTGHPLHGKALRTHVESSVTRSCQRLGRDELDLLQIHNADLGFASDEVLDLTDSLCRRGQVRYWGTTSYTEEAAAETLDHAHAFNSIQIACNALDPQVHGRVAQRCRRTGLGLIVRSVFLKGVLSNRRTQLPPRLHTLAAAADCLDNLASLMEISLPELALRFSAHLAGVSTTLFGTTSAAELQSNLFAFTRGPLPAHILSAIGKIEVEDTSLLNPGTWDI